MKELFDNVSLKCSKLVTKEYSTSFSFAVNLLSSKIRADIYNIYGFVRFADEIVDSFHDYDKELLLNNFEKEYYVSNKQGISLNPILNSFQKTIKKYNIPDEMIQSFLKSMRTDLYKTRYNTKLEYDDYIYGSANVVGLMCLKVFVNGDNNKYEELKNGAMRLGAAFQKVNFLRDLKNDFEVLNRLYFPNLDIKKLNLESKRLIISEIEEDFNYAYHKGIVKLPIEAKLGVYVAYRYYKRLLKKLKATPSEKLIKKRVRISNLMKLNLFAISYVKYKLNII